jgi:MFS family permease
LTFGVALVPAGRLGDLFGRRRMFLIALTSFVLASALTGAAPTTGLLIAARLVQGLAGVPVPMAGAAGGALRTGQRIGSAVGTAVLASPFYAVLGRTADDFGRAVWITLLGAVGFMLLALFAAAVEPWRRQRREIPEPERPRPTHLAPHHV